jgi:hypothetical protein
MSNDVLTALLKSTNIAHLIMGHKSEDYKFKNMSMFACHCM